MAATKNREQTDKFQQFSRLIKLSVNPASDSDDMYIKTTLKGYTLDNSSYKTN